MAPLVVGLLLSAPLPASAAPAGPAAVSAAAASATPDVPVVAEQPSYDVAEPAGADAGVSLVVGLTGGSATAPVDRLEAATGIDATAPDRVAGTGAVTVDVPAGDAAEAAAALRRDPAVAYVEQDRIATVDAVGVNDPYRGSQWGLDKAHLPLAWDIARGAPDIVVAVIDTGVTTTTDLTGRVLPGRDFVNNDYSAVDDNGHGTEVASVITGLPNNGVATAGICWTCRILPVKALGANGSGTYTAIAKSITWAADQGADIINLSLGGDTSSSLLTSAVNYAIGKGALVVAAAGNDGVTARHYPAAIEGVLAVGASTSDDQRYSWSNHGAAWVDIAAPGCNLAQGRDNTVDWFCGTSSATPFVSGVAALAASLDPQPTATQIRNLLTATARPVGGWVADGRVEADEAITLSSWENGVTAGQHVRGIVNVDPWYNEGLHVTRVVAALDGVVKATDTTAPWSLPVSTAGANGPSSLVVTAYDDTDTQVGQPFTTSVIVDNSIPTVSFAGALPARVRGAVTVAASAADAVRVSRVDLLADGRVVASDAAAPWSLRWTSTGSGARTLTLRAYDGAGNLGTAVRKVTADNAGPAARIAAGPKNRAKVRDAVTVRVQASDPAGVARTQLLVNGKVAGTVAGAAGTIRVKTTRYGRTLRVKVRAYDRLGNVSHSTTRTWKR